MFYFSPIVGGVSVSEVQYGGAFTLHPFIIFSNGVESRGSSYTVGRTIVFVSGGP
jgi:hypothetical protein